MRCTAVPVEELDLDFACIVDNGSKGFSYLLVAGLSLKPKGGMAGIRDSR